MCGLISFMTLVQNTSTVLKWMHSRVRHSAIWSNQKHVCNANRRNGNFFDFLQVIDYSTLLEGESTRFDRLTILELQNVAIFSARDYLHCPGKKHSVVLYHLIKSFIRSRWLGIGLVLFFWRVCRPRENKPHAAWSITIHIEGNTSALCPSDVK